MKDKILNIIPFVGSSCFILFVIFLIASIGSDNAFEYLLIAMFFFSATFGLIKLEKYLEDE